MGSNVTPDEPDGLGDGEDFEGEDDIGDKEPLFSCPFCVSKGHECPHILGTRDMNFCSDFSVDEYHDLAELSQLFWELGEKVDEFLATGKKKARIAALVPGRLRALVQGVAGRKSNHGFTQYVEQVAKDTRVAVRSDSYEENGGPGFSSVVRIYWTRDVPTVVAGMRKRVTQDIRRLQPHTKPGATADGGV